MVEAEETVEEVAEAAAWSGVAFAEGTNQRAKSTAPAAAAVTSRRRCADKAECPAPGTKSPFRVRWSWGHAVNWRRESRCY
ncbi:hypothetical protein GCM10027091_37440 [Streptomyces daliensis]